MTLLQVGLSLSVSLQRYGCGENHVQAITSSAMDYENLHYS